MRSAAAGGYRGGQMRQGRITVDLLWNMPKSRRSIDRATLRELVRGLREEIVPVGVFVNAPKELVAELLEEGTIQIAQLHGQESQEYIQELKVLTGKNR